MLKIVFGLVRVGWRYFYFVIFVLFWAFFVGYVFTFYSMPVGVIGSRQTWVGEPITIILISDRQHIGDCLSRHLFLCLVCVLGLGGVCHRVWLLA